MAYQSYFGFKVQAEPSKQQLSDSRAKQAQKKQQEDVARKQKQQKDQQAAQEKAKQNSLFGKITRGAKSLANSAVTGEKVAATGIARVLPGGTADIEAQRKQAESANKNIQFIKDQQKAGKIKAPAASKIIQANASGASEASKQQSKTIKAMPTKGQLAAGFASTAADIVTAGTLNRAKAGLRSAKELAPVIKTAGKKKVATEVSTQLAANATAGGLNAAAGGGTKKDIISNAAAGAALPEVLRTGGSILGKGITRATDKVSTRGANDLLRNVRTSSLMDKVQTPSRAGSLAVDSVQAPTKIPVQQTSESLSGTVRNALPEIPTSNPVAKPYSDADFRLTFNKNAKEVVKDNPAVASAFTKTGSKDPTTLATQMIADTNAPSKITGTVEKLLPEIQGAEKSQLVKDLTAAKTPQEVSERLWQASQKVNPDVGEIKATPMAKSVSFDTPTEKPVINSIPESVLREAESKRIAEQPVSPELQAIRDAPVRQSKPKTSSEPAKTLITSVTKNAEAERGTSKVAASIQEKAVERGLKKDFGDAGGYDKITIKDQAEKAVALANDRPALEKVISGETPLPNGLRATALIKAVEEHPVLGKDHELINRLSAAEHLTGESSRSAQELRLAAERGSNSPTEAIRKLRQTRSKVLESRTGKTATKAVNDEVKSIQKSKPKVNKETFISFVESLKC